MRVISSLLMISGVGVILGSSPATNSHSAPSIPAADSVTVVVKNRRVDEITVYYEYQSGGRRRLGRIAVGRDELYRIPWRNTQLQLRVRIPGYGETPTNSVDPQPGDTVELMAQASLNPRSLRIIRPQ